MKKSTKIFLTIFLILIIGVFIHPQKVIYEANINGRVIDEKIGSNESRDLRNESVTTDKDGNFKFYEKSRIEWFHTPLDLPIGYCFAEFEIERSGYEPYKSKFGEFRQYRIENCYACEKVEFKPIITLKKIIQEKRTEK